MGEEEEEEENEEEEEASSALRSTRGWEMDEEADQISECWEFRGNCGFGCW